MHPVFIVPHTHWDREWYEPANRFRQRLVAALDATLDVLGDRRLPLFLLDGQTVLLEDYLEVRPERAAQARRLAEQGKLLLGPWYVLADELMAGDEALVRNLMLGKSDAGGGWLRLGYSPDAFGHPATLPTVLAGFGIEHAILWRGYGGRAGEAQDLFQWRGADGAQVLAYHLPSAGYEVGANLPSDPDAARARWTTICGTLEARARGRPLLLLNGADHHVPQGDLPEAMEAAAAHVSPLAAHPLDYFEALPRDLDVPEVTGELRWSYGHCLTLQGTFAVRASLKRAVREAERLLVRWAEPQIALCGATRERGRSLLDRAWRLHLQNCFHDTLCGTITDAVAREARIRAANVIAQARGLADDAVHDRLGQDRSRARRHETGWEPSLVVLNASAHDRSGVVEATVMQPTARIRMGMPEGPAARRRPGDGSPVVTSVDGASLPLQVLEEFDAYDRLDAPDTYPLQDRVRAWRVALWVEGVPALGARTLRARVGQPSPRAAPHAVRVRGDQLRGSRWVVRPGAAGYRIESADVAADGVADVVSESDAGDLYTYEPVSDDGPLAARWGRAHPLWRGPLIGAVGRPFTIPGRVRGVAYARLDAGSTLVRVVIDGENLAGGHRLRVRFPHAAAHAQSHWADRDFGLVERGRVESERKDYPDEWPVETAPLHRSVSVAGGLTVLSRDCFEYEVTKDAIIVTLLRAVSQLSRDDLRARKGHVAWPAATPDARELGRFRAEFALAPRGLGVEAAAEEFHAPLAGRMLRYAIEPPATVRGPRLEGEGLAFRACKVSAADDREIVLRCVNLGPARVRGMWVMPSGVRRAWKARLDETKLDEVTVAGGRRQIVFEAGPREVVTIVAAWMGRAPRKR